MDGIIKKLRNGQSGAFLVESAVALAILGIIAVGLLSGLVSSARATIIDRDKVMAESLARSEIEYIKGSNYSNSYIVDNTLDIPDGWNISPEVGTVYSGENAIQKITVSVAKNSREILSLVTYKVDR